MQIDKKDSAVVRGEREGIWGVRGGGGGEGWGVKNCLRLGEEVGSVEQCYEWIESLTPPNTLNSLSQAAAAVCGMRGAGWELLDSWILEACGLISRTKPTQWGGADVAFFPLNWNFLPAREEVAQSLYWLAAVVKEFAHYVWLLLTFLGFFFLKALFLLDPYCFGHMKGISLPSFLCPWLFDSQI